MSTNLFTLSRQAHGVDAAPASIPAGRAASHDLGMQADRLGDLGAFGPHPDRVFPLLIENRVVTMQGNYDNSIGGGLADCQCCYTDPRDNHFARISYDYTFRHTSEENRVWLRSLPMQR